ncbi:MAG TPA: hypothetical protein VH968_07630 [Gaiellaceae bacterium]|jgi:hypothetical protein
MWAAALRRLTGLFVLASALTLVGALIFGVALGADPSRAVSVGFYLMGSFLLVAGFFVGNRGPVRFKRESGAPLFWGSRFVRWASPAEREENINLSAIFVVLGFVLILVGVVADNRYDLV